MGGILALKKNECHAAPMHLLADDGDYNIPYLKKYLPGEDVVLICVTERQQGIVSKDAIGFNALSNHTFVNRQRGSGTGCCSITCSGRTGSTHRRSGGMSAK